MTDEKMIKDERPQMIMNDLAGRELAAARRLLRKIMIIKPGRTHR